MPAESRWRALVNAAAAVRSTDPATVESALTALSGRRRWLALLVGRISSRTDGPELADRANVNPRSSG